MSRLILVTLAAFALIGCGRKDAEPPASFKPEKAAGATGTVRDKVGRIYHYVRSNVDGSNPEDLYVFRKRVDQIQTYRSRQKCLEPDIDTADVNLEGGHATKIVRARLNKKGVAEEYASLDYNSALKELRARIEVRDGEPATASIKISGDEWHLYDLDLTTLNTTAPRKENLRAGFSFGLPLMIADADRAEFLVALGEAEAEYRGEEQRLGRATLRFSLGGPALGSYGGNLWLDAREGHIVDVETGFPNHPDYADFKLALRDVKDASAAEWAELLRKHFDGCN
jgi:hypothetical protein